MPSAKRQLEKAQFEEDGDMAGTQTWHRILDAIERLRAKAPAVGEAVHEKFFNVTPPSIRGHAFTISSRARRSKRAWRHRRPRANGHQFRPPVRGGGDRGHRRALVVQSMTSPVSEPTAFQREVASRFGLVPNFFSSAPDAPELVERLWVFAKAAYLDSPIPALFKERLFVYLSRFCEVRYCIARHCAFLVGNGHSSGDPSAAPQTIEQAIRLLRTPPPWQRDINTVLRALETGPTEVDWPTPEADLEDRVFSAATIVFVEPAKSARARRALRQALGGERLELLLGLLAFIRTAHYWTVVHPEILYEKDIHALISANAELAMLLLKDPEAATGGGFSSKLGGQQD